MSDVSDGPQSRLRESISALVDGEADELELRRVLASADTQEVRNTWRDYHLQRDMMAGVDMRFAAFDLSQAVQNAIAQDQLPAAGGARWWRPLASVAVAASVATIVVVGARSFNSSSNENIAATQSQPAANALVSFPALSQPVASPIGSVTVGAQLGTLAAPGINAQPAALDPDQFAQQRLQQYLLRHTERAALNNGQGVINFVKVSDLGNAQ